MSIEPAPQRHKKESAFALPISYLAYYWANLLMNALIIILYALALADEHEDCFTRNGTNASDRF